MNSSKFKVAAAVAILVAVLIGAALFLKSRDTSHSALVVEPVSGAGQAGAASAVSGVQPVDLMLKEGSGSSSAQAGAAVNPSPHDLHQLKVLDEILESRNDNDPRMDSDLRGLSPAAKKLMEEKYKTLAMEKRNERGTIAFLIGRELSTAEDVAFLGSVLSEPPCLSMGDCTREEKPIERGEAHHESGLDLSLHYPQMVSLYSIESQITLAEQGKKLDQIENIRKVLDDASRSPVPRVADKARALLVRLKELKS